MRFGTQQSEAKQALDSSRVTKLTAWFALNKVEAEHPPSVRDESTLANNLLYHEIPRKYTCNKNNYRAMPWRRRKQRNQFPPIGRIYTFSPRDKERYFLRILLSYVTGAQCFADIRTVNDVECETYFAACAERGLLADDQEWIKALAEKREILGASALRQLFVILLTHCAVTKPLELWERFKKDLYDDFAYNALKELRNRDTLPDVMTQSRLTKHLLTSNVAWNCSETN